MDASAGSSPPHSQENPPKHGGGRGKAPAAEIRGEAADDFLFADDTFPSLPDFPCLSSPSSSTFSSSSSSNSSCAFTTAAGGGGRGSAGEPSEPATAADGFDSLADIDQLLDFASLPVPWDAEPLFPEVGMMIEDAISEQPPPVSDGADGSGDNKAVLEEAGGEEAGEASMGAAAGDDLPRFFMEWLTSNRDNISAEDLRSIRLRRSTIEAAAARLGGGRQGTMQLLKLILTWVQNHHVQKKHPRDAIDEAAGPHSHGHGQLPSPGANPGYEFPAGDQDMSVAATSWMPYQAFMHPAYGGEAMYPTSAGPYPFRQSCSTSSVVVSSQPFSPPPASDMHAASGGNMAWPHQYVPLPAASTGSYPMPPVVPQPYAPGFAGQYPGGPPMCPQRMAGMEPSATKEARKKRMARQRRLSCLQQQRSQQQLNLSQIQSSSHPQEPSPRSTHSAPVTPSSGGCRGWGLWSPGSQVQNPLSKSNSSRSKQQKPLPEAATASKSASGEQQEGSPQRSTASDKRQGAKTDNNLRFLLQKVLKQSDVGSLGRIVLPKKEAEIHLPELKTRDGISIPIEDIGTSRVWSMRYRFWPNNKSRMYLLENTGDFVRSNELQEGDFIVIYSDVKSGKYLIRGVKVRPPQEQAGNSSAGAVGKHKHGFPEKAGESDPRAVAEDGSVDGGKPDGCKGKPPRGVRRSRQEATFMNQAAVSI